MTLTYEQPQEYKSMSTYVVGNGSGTLNINPNGYNNSMPQTSQTLTIKITPANGGTIVQMQTSDYGTGELYIIPGGIDFDRELGKIITMSKLKS